MAASKISGIRGLGGKVLTAASYALLPKKRSMCDRRGIDILSPVFYQVHSSAQMCFVSGALRAPATDHRSFCEHCYSWSRVGGYINTFLCCCVLAADGSLSCSPAIYHLDSSNIKIIQNVDLGGNSQVDSHTACVPPMAKLSPYLARV